MEFEIISRITRVQTIATGKGIKIFAELVKKHGKGPWRKLKGQATVQLSNGNSRLAEVHWYEAHGIGKRECKIKRFLD